MRLQAPQLRTGTALLRKANQVATLDSLRFRIYRCIGYKGRKLMRQNQEVITLLRNDLPTYTSISCLPDNLRRCRLVVKYKDGVQQ